MNNGKEADSERQQQDLLRFVESKSVTRRDFIQYAAAIGVATTAATSLWSEKVMAAPKRGGHLRVGSEGGCRQLRWQVRIGDG